MSQSLTTPGSAVSFANDRPRADVAHAQPHQVEVQLQDAVEDVRVISLAGGVPADELFPSHQIEEALAASLREDAARVLQYGWPGGMDRLRGQIADRMAERGVTVRAEQILITSGAQQGLSLLSQLLLPEGAPIAVEIPTYSAALQAFDLRKPLYRPVPRSTEGLDLDALEAALGPGGARVLYLVATGHNPTGGLLGRSEREAVLACAERHGAWVIDDDAYGEIQFGALEQPLLALGHPHTHTLHLGSFSKVLAPGLRVGWIAGPEDIIAEASRVKQAWDLETAMLNQRVLSAWLDEHSLRDHITRCLVPYRRRRDALAEALRVHMPPGTRWALPAGGFSLLLTLPAPLRATALLPQAFAQGVAFEPAAPYFVETGVDNTLRLSFSNVSEADLRRGARRLGTAMVAALEAEG